MFEKISTGVMMIHARAGLPGREKVSVTLNTPFPTLNCTRRSKSKNTGCNSSDTGCCCFMSLRSTQFNSSTVRVSSRSSHFLSCFHFCFFCCMSSFVNQDVQIVSQWTTLDSQQSNVSTKSARSQALTRKCEEYVWRWKP